MNLLKAFAMVSGFTMLSRITGLFREILIARMFGAGPMTDAYNVAFRIPNLLRRLSAEGAFSQAFLPILAEYKTQQGQNETKRFIDAVATILFWILLLLTFTGVLGATGVVYVVATGLSREEGIFDAAIFMTRVMFSYIVLISLTTLGAGVLNAWRQFSLPAFAPVLLNVSSIFASLWVAPHLETPVYALAYGVIAGGILQLSIQLPALSNIGMIPRISFDIRAAWSHQGVKRVMSQMLPATLAVSIAQVSLMINTNIASRLTQGSVSWLAYADRLMEFPTALLGVALGTILLPNLSTAHADGDPNTYSSLLDWGLRLTFLLATPSAVSLFIYAEPLTATIYQYGHFDAHDVLMTAHALTAYGIGLVGLILIKILASAFYAKRDIKTPVKIAVLVLIATQLANLLFVRWFAHAGLTLSIGVGACMNAALLFVGLYRRGIYRPASGWRLFFAQLLAACLLLSGMLLWFAQSFDWIALGQHPFMRVALLSGSLLLCGVIYFLALFVMGFNFSFFRRDVA
ncbi:murein biosynthesis integral membrane protein MurJ [Candidatus Pandoraea novymonadis]|uniref:Probable lipid II flippase MurJ n=1 Tax=Candidatus Pandoraea novymonadis TaxID=1808959 RepID=A0ABX5FDI5_9BURK|nr:murein biosynthesis integral membrane protein MurJ [Candidatus Pandoraea novymonadis]PSB91818.1 Lipid II flippase MurJ [Candidatus Pandoraea novymonadis]